MPEDKYEFTFRLTNVELTDEQRDSVARAVTLAGVEAVGDGRTPLRGVSAPPHPGCPNARQKDFRVLRSDRKHFRLLPADA
jgi:hypothetical protein